MPIIRFLLRFLIVPVGMLLAVSVSILVLTVTHWQAFSVAVGSQPDMTLEQLAAAMALSPILLYLLIISGVRILLPALIGVLIAEVFAIRSFLFHALNGALSAGIGWSLAERLDDTAKVYGDPKLIIAAGLAAGVAYWLVAGWNAGLWLPARQTPAAP